MEIEIIIGDLCIFKKLKKMADDRLVESEEANPSLSGFQLDAVNQLLHSGRAVMFAESGLGKTRMMQMAIQGERKKRRDKVTDTRLNLVGDIITDAQRQIVEKRPVNAMVALAVAKDILANLIEENHGKINKKEDSPIGIGIEILARAKRDPFEFITNYFPEHFGTEAEIKRAIGRFTENNSKPQGNVRVEKAGGDCQCPNCVKGRASSSV